MDLGLDSLLGEEPRENFGIGGCHALAVEKRKARVVDRVGHGEREAAGSESEAQNLRDVEALFGHFVQSHDPEVCHAHRDGLRDVVVAQVENLEREAFGPGDELAFALGDADSRFGEQFDALFIESALGLDRYFQHVFRCIEVFCAPAA